MSITIRHRYEIEEAAEVAGPDDCWFLDVKLAMNGEHFKGQLDIKKEALSDPRPYKLGSTVVHFVRFSHALLEITEPALHYPDTHGIIEIDEANHPKTGLVYIVDQK